LSSFLCALLRASLTISMVGACPCIYSLSL